VSVFEESDASGLADRAHFTAKKDIPGGMMHFDLLKSAELPEERRGELLT
jgi:hypothetical protein